jgi:hypothetical protein
MIEDLFVFIPNEGRLLARPPCHSTRALPPG